MSGKQLDRNPNSDPHHINTFQKDISVSGKNSLAQT
jgi:hypothetical protein